MTSPVIIKPTGEIEKIVSKWKESNRKEQEIIYYRELSPVFVPLFSNLPLHGYPGGRPVIKALISILGFSPQPVALMAGWTGADHILILGTRESLELTVDGDPVQKVVPAMSGLPETRFSFRMVEGSDDLDIYRAVRDFIVDRNLKPHEIAIDPTGGKKSMSISAGLAGFLAGAYILYVDYLEYLPNPRIPKAGTEYPRLLENPLEVFGDLEFQKIWDAYDRGNFEEAANTAREISQRLYEPREAEALEILNRGYGAWNRFEFKTALNAFEKLDDYLARFQKRGRWTWSETISAALNVQLPLLRDIIRITDGICRHDVLESFADGLPLIFNHIETARRVLNYNQTGAAVLLTYASLERYTDLALRAFFGLDDEKPDYSSIDPDMDAYHKAGRALHGKDYRETPPAGPVTLSLGLKLLAALKPELMPEKYMGDISKLIQHRNKCEYEHGLCPNLLKKKDIEKHIGTVRKLMVETLAPFGVNVDRELMKYRFPKI